MTDENVNELKDEQLDELESYKFFLNELLKKNKAKTWGDLNNNKRRTVISDINKMADEKIGYNTRNFILVYFINNENQVQLIAAPKIKLDSYING